MALAVSRSTLVAAVAAAGLLVLPSASTAAPTAANKHAVSALIDAFVPAAVERRNPLRALPLVTPAFRAGVTRKQWAHGDLPVMPYQATGKHFPWTLDYSSAHEIRATVLLHPAPKEKLGAIAFTAVFKQHGKRWLIDSFIPAASFAPGNARPSILAQTDFLPGGAAEAPGSAKLDQTWLLVPGGFFALIVLGPLAILFVKWRRDRRAWLQHDRPA
jgi:hypothetical protein